MANLTKISLNNDASNVVDAYPKAETDALLDDKMDLVASPTADNILITDANGQAVDSGVTLEAAAEPFRVKKWDGSWSDGVTIPTCTTEISNTQIAKMVFSIDAEEGAKYQIVGMIAYEVFDAVSGGNRLNCWPVCQFTGNGQKELSVRWMCGGTSNKLAKRISAWVLLKRR